MRRAAAVLAIVAAVASGCAGGGDSPSVEDRVPALSAGLARVDAALAAHEFASARKDLRALRTTVQKARRSDTLSASDAARVLRAIDRLLAVMPSSAGPTPGAVSSSPTPSSAPTHRRPRPTATPTQSPTTTEPSPTSSPTATEPSPSTSATADSSPTPAGATATP